MGKHDVKTILVGGFNHLEKYENQLGRIIPIYYGKIKHAPNHQPVWETIVFFFFNMLHNYGLSMHLSFENMSRIIL